MIVCSPIIIKGGGLVDCMSVEAATGNATLQGADLGELSKDELLLLSRRLQQENEVLRSMLMEQKKNAVEQNDDTARATTAQREAEIAGYTSQIRIHNATIIRQHEELLELRKRCAAYSTAVEETTRNFEELKVLYAELKHSL